MKKKEFELFGIFGFPLGHTLSPVMQEAAFEAMGHKAFYLVLELSPKNFHQTLRGLHSKSFQLSGFNVTVPYKEAVIAYLDKLEPSAKLIGAVNTVYQKGGKWIGANTDAFGFQKAIKTEWHRQKCNVLILGAGGSARALGFALAKDGARRITIANRTKIRALRMLRDLSKTFKETKFQALELSSRELKRVLNEADVVINATSVGLKVTDPSLIPAKLIPAGKRKLFVDLIYRPSKTAFLRNAAKKGHRTLNGLSMLLHQGAKSFECWTGRRAPVSVMRKTLSKAIKEAEK